MILRNAINITHYKDVKTLNAASKDYEDETQRNFRKTLVNNIK